MIRKQLLIVAGALPAVVICLALFVSLRLGGPPAPEVSPGDRLAYAAHWLLVPGLCLFAGIAMTANRRFFSEQAIDGERTGVGRTMEINLRYNQNTLEQTVLAAVAWTGLALALPSQDLRLIPALAGLFAVGRIAFWIGYLMAPWARAFGLGLTAYPTFAALVWLGIRLVRDLV